jgi:hypothetical protein
MNSTPLDTKLLGPTLMSRKNRQSKTPARKLRDLEDHLHFLRESLAKLMAGDDAYLKPLAAELRVLVCKSSGTEGLLWRILDECKVDDIVHVHLACQLNRDHYLAPDIQFAFVHIARAGTGDVRLPARHWSLKAIIKGCEAVVVAKEGYTHESLIRAVSEQIGSAHEDDGAAPYLVELTRTIMANKPLLIHVLCFDADLVLEVGERTLGRLERDEGFIRRIRAPVVTPTIPDNFRLSAHDDDFEGAPAALPPEGTLMLAFNHPDPDWRQNATTYNFGLFAQGKLKLSAVKHPDRTMELVLEGLGQSKVATRKAIPNTDQPGVVVAIAWTDREVRFYLCGERVDCQEYPSTDDDAQLAPPVWRWC